MCSQKMDFKSDFVIGLFSIAVLMMAAPASAVAVSNIPAATIVDRSAFVAQRAGRFAVITLKAPHRVLSTSRINGGQTEDIKYLVNHQSMEASGDHKQYEKILSMSGKNYHQSVADELGLNAAQIALMGTAANINHTAHVTYRFKTLRVDAFVTAGVSGNAMRAGDTARWYQGDNGNEFVPQHGTINTILMINKPLTQGAQSRAVITMVEAKSAALAELAVPSKESSHLATGTGTDQYIIAAPLDKNLKALESTSPHLKIGELIGRAVFDATKEALRWQNGLEASSTRNITRALGRFGLSEKNLLLQLKKQLSDRSYQLLLKNKNAMLTEPRVAAAAYAYAAVLDRLQYKTISVQLAQETLKDQAANVAVALSFKTRQWSSFWVKITVKDDDYLAPFIQALALGWEEKWKP